MKNKELLKNKIEKAEMRTWQWANGINIEFPGEEDKNKFYGKSYDEEEKQK